MTASEALLGTLRRRESNDGKRDVETYVAKAHQLSDGNVCRLYVGLYVACMSAVCRLFGV